MAKKRFLVVGAGVLGKSVSFQLSKLGQEVVVLDTSEEEIDVIKDHVDVAMVGDAHDRKLLDQLDLKSFDTVVICIGEDFQSSILATVHMLDLKVKHIAVRANSEMEANILRKLGVHEIFFVERAMGEIIAHKLSDNTVIQEFDIGDGYRIIQTKAFEEMSDRALKDINLPKNFGIQVIAVKSDEEKALKRPEADTVLTGKDILFVSGHQDDLEKFLKSRKQKN